MNESDHSVIEEGYAALRRGDSAEARVAFASDPAHSGRVATLEGTARADYLDHEYLPAIERWCSAYEAYRREGDGVGAIRVARTLAYMYMSILGDPAVGGGWFARALSLLADEGPCIEWVGCLSTKGCSNRTARSKSNGCATRSPSFATWATRRSSS